MKPNQLKLAKFRPLRSLITLCVCALLVFSSAMPALAARSGVTKGEEKLTGIEQEAQKMTKEQPQSRGRTQAKANRGGVNEVQGSANAENMYRPDNIRGDASVEGKVQRSLEKATGKI